MSASLARSGTERRAMSDITRTLTTHDYCSEQVYEIERQRFFHGGWFLALRADTLAPGNRTVVDVAGESILVTRDLEGVIHAFANVCRHRGAKLCDERSDSNQGSLMCPYHAWTYALDGRLIATPHLDNDDVDKAALSLWSVASSRVAGLRLPVPRQGAAGVRRMGRAARSRARRPRAVRSRAPEGRRAQRVRGRRQLEGHRRELPGVPALHAGASRTGRAHPHVSQRLGVRPQPRRRRRAAARRRAQPGHRRPEQLADPARPQRSRRVVVLRLHDVPERVRRRHRHLRRS